MPLSNRPVYAVYERHDYFSCTGINAADRKIFATGILFIIYHDEIPLARIFNTCWSVVVAVSKTVKKKGGGEGYGRYLAEGTSGGKKLNKTALIIRRDVEEWNFYYVGMNETGLKKN